MKKHEFVKLDLKSHPGDDASETYSLNAHCFDSGAPSDWTDWHESFEKVATGHLLTDGLEKHNMACALLCGDALRVFNKAVLDAGLQAVTEVVAEHMFP